MLIVSDVVINDIDQLALPAFKNDRIYFCKQSSEANLLLAMIYHSTSGRCAKKRLNAVESEWKGFDKQPSALQLGEVSRRELLESKLILDSNIRVSIA